MSHWLLHYALPRAENAAIYTLTAGLTTTLILAPFRGLIRKFWRAVDSIDPATDRGVTKQLKDLDDSLASHGNRHIPRSPTAR